jgi:hypothetical protein
MRLGGRPRRFSINLGAKAKTGSGLRLISGCVLRTASASMERSWSLVGACGLTYGFKGMLISLAGDLQIKTEGLNMHRCHAHSCVALSPKTGLVVPFQVRSSAWSSAVKSCEIAMSCFGACGNEFNRYCSSAGEREFQCAAELIDRTDATSVALRALRSGSNCPICLTGAAYVSTRCAPPAASNRAPDGHFHFRSSPRS